MMVCDHKTRKSEKLLESCKISDEKFLLSRHILDYFLMCLQILRFPLKKRRKMGDQADEKEVLTMMSQILRKERNHRGYIYYFYNLFLSMLENMKTI